MRIVAADHDRLYQLPGVPEPALRPVEIDAAHTGFIALRSLRLYRFHAGTPVEGHAEEDEVFLVVTAGSVHLEITSAGGGSSTLTATLTAPTLSGVGGPFVAYLPPHASYRLTPIADADIAYARATPADGRGAPPAVFHPDASLPHSGLLPLLRQQTHAHRLQLSVTQISADPAEPPFHLRSGADTDAEALVHLQGTPGDRLGIVHASDGTGAPLGSWDTLALAPGEDASLLLEPGAHVLLVTVVAR